jgi:ADP-ribose pyrophosphatase
MRSFRDAQVLATRSLHQGRVFNLDSESVRMPNGRETTLDVIRHPGAATIVPLTADGDVLLVRQYRHATREWLLEVPAGTLAAGETPEACARREVAEETGHEAAELTPLGSIWTTPGFTDERIWMFLARGLTPCAQNLDDDESLVVERVRFAAAVAMAEGGEISDAKSICSLLRARARLGVRDDR